MTDMLFQGWAGIFRTVIVGAFAYAGLVAMLRVSGKRTLAKLNAFDLVVTVALGSILATLLLSKGVALAEGLTAFALLIALQWLVARSSTRSRRVARLVRSEPTLLLRDGEVLFTALDRAHLTEGELMMAIRSSGHSEPADITAVILESNGTLSVIARGRDSGKIGRAGAIPR